MGAPRNPAGSVLPGLDKPAHRSAVLKVWEGARCVDVNPELFFPDPGAPSQAALAVCAACPVRELCRATFGPIVAHGVVGGTTAQDRAVTRRGARGGEVAA